METPLIGREYETQILLESYQKLENSHGGIVVVTGDAGLGKSRLIAESIKQFSSQQEHQSNPLWLFGRGLSYRQSFQNRLFVDILYSYLDLPENADESLVKLRLEAMGDELFGERKSEVVPYLTTMLGIKMDGDADSDLVFNDPQILQQRIFLAMGEWVEVLASQQPVVMVFEDLHWADPSSVTLIEYLYTLTVYNPILMICVSRLERDTRFWTVRSRSAQEYSENFTEMTLWPLTDEESRQVIRHLLKIDPMPQALENLLLNRAEGNPLFLEEVLRSLIEEGAIKRADDRWEIARSVTDIEIPNTLQGVLTARIDRLDEPVKRVLQVAAVIGRVFPRFILEPIVNEPDILEKALDVLEVADLIEVRTREPEAEYMFKHVLTYETAYHSLLHQQRQLIHRQIGDYMSRLYWQLGEQYAPIVAEHYYKSKTWPRALRYLHRAAEAAVQSFANQEALKYYARALEVAEIIGPEADQVTILANYEGRARIFTRLGEPQNAMDDYKAMLAKAKQLRDDSAQMRALNGSGALQASHHDFARASEFFQKALAVARRIGDERGIADTLNQLGNFYYNMGQLELATKCFQEARDISQNMNNEVGRITSEDGLAKIMLEQGEIVASLNRYQQDIIPVRRRQGFRGGLMDSLSTVLMAQVNVADYAGAEETAQELLELHKKSGDLNRVPLIKYYQALGQFYQGFLDQAGENLTEGLHLAQGQGQKSFQALCMASLGFYYLNLGLAEKGLILAKQSVEIAEELGSPLYVMKAQTILGASYRYLGRGQEGVALLEAVHEAACGMGFTPDEVVILNQLTRAYLDTDRLDQAQLSLEKMLALANASEMKEFIARGLWLQAQLEVRQQHFETALEALVLASNMAQEIDSRISQYLIQIEKAYVYQVAANDPASRDAMIYAQRIQKKLADNLEDDGIRQAFLSNANAVRLQDVVEAHMKQTAA
jgi:tetratricopeptide (TPR) repeat protein